MPKVKTAVAAIVLLMGFVAASVAADHPVPAQRAPTVMITDNDNGRSFPARVGEVVEFHLSENATTGYRWAPEGYDEKRLKLVGTEAGNPGAAIGSGGEAIFRFQIVGLGSSTVSLRYWRHWEGPSSIIRRFSVTIDVDQ